VLVLACGIAGGALFYWVQTRSAVPQIDEGAAGYARAQEHQMRLMMGPLGVTLMQWMDALTGPGIQALLIVAFSGFIAYMCFRHARFPAEPQ
jgi:hypothetical protein